MAYNNSFPATYQPYYPQYTPQPVQPQAPAPMPAQSQASGSSNLTWVQGEAGAKSYLVAPNTTVQLWDSEAQTIYLKSADASGMPSMKILDYTIRSDQPAQMPQVMEQPAPDYVTHEELKSFKEEIQAMIKPPARKGAAKDE